MKILVACYPFLNDDYCQQGMELAINPWGRGPTADEIEEELCRGRYEGLIVGTRHINEAIALKCPELKVISRVGVGYDNIDVAYFRSHGIVTTYTPFGPTDSTAEMALALMLAGTRRLAQYDQEIRGGAWNRQFGLRMKDATIGIAGYGRIGKRLAVLLRAFGCRILLHDIAPDLATANALGLEFVSKDELLERADIISIHLPLKKDTRDWLGAREMSRLKRPVTLVNTARGGIINEQAVYQYLVENPESFFCCDVFEEEPYNGELTRLDNALLTPHASSFTVGSRLQTERQALQNCWQVLNGQECPNSVEENE